MAIVDGEYPVSKIKKWTLISLGSFFVGVATVGIFVPLLPTTPFLLLAAACYLRSSHRLYRWLLNNRFWGKYLKDYVEKRAVPLQVKLVSILLLWLTILYSVIFITDLLWLRILLLAIAAGVSAHIFLLRSGAGKNSKP